MSLSQQRNKSEYIINPAGLHDLKIRMLDWANQFGIHLYMDSNSYPSKYGSYECLLATGAVDTIIANQEDGLSALLTLHNARKDWLFGHISYEYKSVLFDKLHSRHLPTFTFPLLHFFVPETVCYINPAHTTLTIESFGNNDAIYKQIISAGALHAPLPRLEFISMFDKPSYIDVVERLRSHIAEGDCYEINFCNKGFCENVDVEPLAVFKALNKLSPAPFAAYYKLNGQYMMCASPERYIKKKGSTLLSQPIKGTARRSADATLDDDIKEQLRNDIKERAENVMIVDLVRNDLAKACEVGSITVDELFGIYTYPQVHQMVSTVSGTLKEGSPFTDALRHSYPMGSMTGAPKYKVMQLIEQYERAQRELFSGTVGYITPNGDFDFNVVIRSLFYNAGTRYLSYQTGGAITYDSIPAQEWEEMRLKAWALERIFA